ncbi:unnamed protein product, partial [Scytosiphon promiscuus]
KRLRSVLLIFLFNLGGIVVEGYASSPPCVLYEGTNHVPLSASVESRAHQTRRTSNHQRTPPEDARVRCPPWRCTRPTKPRGEHRLQHCTCNVVATVLFRRSILYPLRKSSREGEPSMC